MYTGADYAALLERFRQLSDEKYRRFNQSLIPGAVCAYGVRIPQLRAIAKEIAAGDWRGYLASAQDGDYTERMLQALVIDHARCEPDESWRYIEAFVPKIDNWAVCDTFSGGLKRVRNDRAGTLPRLTKYLCSKNEFEVRFGVVMLMDHFITDEYADTVLNEMDRVRHDGYYAKMAVAWTVAECIAKYRDKTFMYLQQDKLDTFTHNKAIQKARESYRVSDEDKRLLLTMKRQND